MRCELRADHTGNLHPGAATKILGSPERPKQAFHMPWGTLGARVVSCCFTKACLTPSICVAHNAASNCSADNLPRLHQVNDLLAQFGTIKQWWMPTKRNYALVVYSTVAEARAAFEAVDHMSWPDKLLANR